MIESERVGVPVGQTHGLYGCSYRQPPQLLIRSLLGSPAAQCELASLGVTSILRSELTVYLGTKVLRKRDIRGQPMASSREPLLRASSTESSRKVWSLERAGAWDIPNRDHGPHVSTPLPLPPGFPVPYRQGVPEKTQHLFRTPTQRVPRSARPSISIRGRVHPMKAARVDEVSGQRMRHPSLWLTPVITGTYAGSQNVQSCSRGDERKGE